MKIHKDISLLYIIALLAGILVGLVIGIILAQLNYNRPSTCNDKSVIIETKDGIKTITYIPSERYCND